MFKNCAFKRAVMTLLKLGSHNCTITTLSMAVVAKTPVELMRKRGGRVLLRPAKADQSKPIGLFWRRALKGQAPKWSVQTEAGQRCCSNGQYEKKIMPSLNSEACKHYLGDT